MAFQWLGVARGHFFCLEWLGAFFCFRCLHCLSQTMFATRAFKVLRQYPTPTTVFTIPILLPLEICFDRTTHDLSVVFRFPEVQKKRNSNDVASSPSKQTRHETKVECTCVPWCGAYVFHTLPLLSSLYLLYCVFFLHFPSPLRVSSGFSVSHTSSTRYLRTRSGKRGQRDSREYDFLCVQCFFFATKVY